MAEELTIVKSWPAEAGGSFDPSPAEAAMLAEIRRRESSENYKATNPNSTASGAYQFINSTWRMASDATGAPRYATAAEAPRSVQDQNALYLLRQFGPNAKISWAASGPYTIGRGTAARAETAPDAGPAAPEPDDFIGRMAAGEDIQLTPQMIGQLIQGPAPQTTAAARAPVFKSDEGAPLTIVKSWPYQPPPPPPEPFSLANQVGAGIQGVAASSSRLAANTAEGLAWVSEKLRLPQGATEAWRDVADWARQQQITAEIEQRRLTGGRTDLGSQVTRGITQGVGDLPKYIVGGALLGPKLGIAAVEALRESDQGFWPALKAAGEGLLTGKVIEVIGPYSRPIRLTGAGLYAYAQARLAGADNETALANATSMGVLSALPGGGKTVRELAQEAGESRVGGAVKAAAPDVAKGTAKIAAGTAAAQILPGEVIRMAVGGAPAYMGARQIMRGLGKGVEAYRAGRPGEAAAAPAEEAPPAAAEKTTGTSGPAVTGITDDALQQLYSVETDPAKRAALQTEMENRGLTAAQPAPAANPYRDYTPSALRQAYKVEQNPARRAQMEQVAQDAGFEIAPLTREARRATVTPPETGAPEERGPSMTQEDAAMLSRLGIDPSTADAGTIAAARQIFAEEQARTATAPGGSQGEPPPVPPQQGTYLAPDLTADEVNGLMNRQAAKIQNLAARGNTPEVQAAIERELATLRDLGNHPAVKPEVTPPPAVTRTPAAPVAAPEAAAAPITAPAATAPATGPLAQNPAALELARRLAAELNYQMPPPATAEPFAPPTAADLEITPGMLREANKVQTITDYAAENGITSEQMAKFRKQEWQLLARYAKVTEPTAEQIAQIRRNVTARQSQAAFRQAQQTGASAVPARIPAARATQVQPEATTPVGPATAEQGLTAAQGLAEAMPEFTGEVPERPVALTATEKRIEMFAQHIAKDPGLTMEMLERLPNEPNARQLFQTLGRALARESGQEELGAVTAGEIHKIIDRVRELRRKAPILKGK